jgi:MFS family permease
MHQLAVQYWVKLTRTALKAFFTSFYVILCSASAAIGGFLFGFDQGLISIVLGMPQFLESFPEIDGTVNSSAAFNKGYEEPILALSTTDNLSLMTALLELGAAFGALQSGYAADRISRRYVLMLGTVWFIIGSTLQTSAFHFAQLVVGRFIGGVGIGTLACVAPLFIGEIAPPPIFEGACSSSSRGWCVWEW